MATAARTRYGTDAYPELDTDPAYLDGRPRVAGTRISVAHVLGMLGAGRSVDDVLATHPTLTRAGILACLRYALRNLVTTIELDAAQSVNLAGVRARVAYRYE